MAQYKEAYHNFTLFTQPRNTKQKVFLLLAICLILTLLLLDWSFVRYRLLNEAPTPAYWGGQKVVTWRWAYLVTSPQRNDLIIYNIADNIYHVGAVIAIPGDQVASFNGALYINAEPFPTKGSTTGWSNQATVIIPPHYVGVLAHNVDTKQNKFELIPLQTLQGKILGHWQVLLL